MHPAPKRPGSNRTGRPVWPWLLAALVWTLVIWSNSMHSAEQSNSQSRQVLQWLVPFLRLTGLEEMAWHTLVRKLAHMAEFALAGVLWACALVPRGRSGWYEAFTRVPALCLLTALADETIQLYIPGRSGQVTDVWIDFLGAVLGMLLVLFIRFLLSRERKNVSCQRAPFRTRIKG